GVLAARRDYAAGMLPQRPGPAKSAASLRSPLALAWRLQRGTLIGWGIGRLDGTGRGRPDAVPGRLAAAVALGAGHLAAYARAEAPRQRGQCRAAGLA